MYTYTDYCCCSVTQSGPTLFVTSWTAAHQASLSFTISHSLLKLMSTKLVMPPNHLFLCHPLLLLLSVFPNIKVFSNESALCIRWPKYLDFSCSISPSNESLELISFRIYYFDFLSVQGTLKSLLQPKMLQPKNINWLNGYKSKTCIYAMYKRSTSYLGTHIDWKWRNRKRSSIPVEIKRKQLQEIGSIPHNDQGIYIYFLWFNKELAPVIMKDNKSKSYRAR